MDAQLNELYVIHIIGVKNYFIRLILEFHVCSFAVHAMYALEVFNFQQWNYVHATAVWTTSCRVSTQYRLKWNPLNASTDLVIIYNSYISFLVYTVLDIAQCYIVCRCCYVQHMPIFEERESLGVKTLKSFADIKKELVMFAIVKYGRSSSLMDLKVIFP